MVQKHPPDERKPNYTDEVIEVYEPGTCPAPGCEDQGPHRHVIRVDKQRFSSTIEGYGPATPIEGVTVVETEQPESEH